MSSVSSMSWTWVPSASSVSESLPALSLLDFLMLMHFLMISARKQKTLSNIPTNHIPRGRWKCSIVSGSGLSLLTSLSISRYSGKVNFPVSSLSLILFTEWSTSMSRIFPRNCLRQLSYAIKNQLGLPKPSTRGFGTKYFLPSLWRL